MVIFRPSRIRLDRVALWVCVCDCGWRVCAHSAQVPQPDGTYSPRVLKLLSEDPANYADAPTEGIRRILEAETGVGHPRRLPLDTSRIESIRMGTTVATNALLERNGERMALCITSGFKDLLYVLGVDTAVVCA